MQHLGIADDGGELTSARIESRLANLPIYVYDLRDSLTYKPLNLGSTDPIALSIVTHISTALRTLRSKHCRRQHLLVYIYIYMITSVPCHPSVCLLPDVGGAARHPR